ncbi:hypothetical protein B9Z52_15355 [Limnohabitans sp. Jir72]|nr:hypothetical protein B9Z52_15355 [Limnohabitans sp. Jir72]
MTTTARHQGTSPMPPVPSVGQPAPRSRQLPLAWFAAFMALSLVAWLYQQINFAGSLDNGIPIPDVINITRTFDNLSLTGGLDQDDNQFLGLSLLFGWTWLVHPSLCFLVNAALMAWATKIYTQQFIDKFQLPVWSIVGVLGNPYLALAMVGPNKEIPLLLLTLIYFKIVSERRASWPLAAALTGVAVFMFRDGYGAFLMGSTLLLLILQFRSKSYALIACIVCALVAALFGILANLVPILSRNNEGFQLLETGNLAVGALADLLGLDPFSPIGGLAMFGLRLVYNLTSLALFPIYETTGGTYWIGWAYWIAGLISLVCIPACIAVLLTSKSARSPLLLCAALAVSAWFMVSVSLFVQPRYLMPVFPYAVAVFSSSPTRIRKNCLRVALMFTVIIVVGYRMIDRAPPLAEPDSFTSPSYVLQP